MSPEAVIFDLDETLFDHRAAAIAGIRAWLTDQGSEPSDHLVELWFKVEERFVRAWHRGEYTFDEQRRERIGAMLSAIGQTRPDRPRLDASFGDYLVHYEAGWRRFDDVEDALARISSAGLQVAVLTNGAEVQQHQKLRAVGLAGRVGPVFCCDALGFAKPDPRAYRIVCDALGVCEQSALHVGDRYDLDVVAAREAGLGAVHLDRDGRGPLREPRRIASLRELDRFLTSDGLA